MDFGTNTITPTPTANRTDFGAVSGTGKIILAPSATGIYRIYAGDLSFPFSGAYEITRSLMVFNGTNCLDGKPALDIPAA